MARVRAPGFSALTVLLCVLARPVFAQNVTGTISGTVSDPSGQPVADATATLTHEGTAAERRTSTDGRGAFTFPAVQPGVYTVRIERAGFQPYERKSNTLTANEQLALGNITLRVGQLAEAVTVTAEGTPVETSTSERSALLSAKQIEMVAVKSRDIMALLKVLPGVTINPNTYTEPDALGAGFGSRIPNIQGTRESFSTITVDGIAGNDMGTPAVFSSTVNFDSIGEVKVRLNNYRAESGRSGGASVSIVTSRGRRSSTEAATGTSGERA